MNVDGAYGRKIMPQPHETFLVPEARQFDSMSCQERISQIEGDLTPHERATVESFVLLCSCGKLENTSFLEFLHWWALCGHTYQGCLDMLITYKFRYGQSTFARKFFEEALETGRLSYCFNTPIATVEESTSTVTVTSRAGESFRASRLVCTIPLNVLSTISFNPPLSQGKQDAIRTGHVNQCVKVHAEITDKDMRSWTGITYPHNKLLYAIADGTTPSGNTHIVAFGADFNHIQAEEDVGKTIGAVQALAPEIRDVQRLVSALIAPVPNLLVGIGTDSKVDLPQLVKGRIRQGGLVLLTARAAISAPGCDESPPRQCPVCQLGLGCRLAKLYRWCHRGGDPSGRNSEGRAAYGTGRAEAKPVDGVKGKKTSP